MRLPRKASLLLIVVFITHGLVAQKTISGHVENSATNEPLPGVNIIIKGTNDGTVTSLDGDYSIPVTEGQTLVFSYVGYRKQEVIVENQTVIDIQLDEDIVQLNEAVVVGYGVVKRSDLTTSSITVKGDDLRESISSGFDQALQGRAAGVVVTQTSGAPGSSVSITIRGNATINSDSEPLYVIDGVPYTGSSSGGLTGIQGAGKNIISPFANINPNDIESIEILKDASATAIYGSRGSNGVILITTKRGKANQTRVIYEGFYGSQEMPKYLNVMNLREFAEYQNDKMAETFGGVAKPEFGDPSLLGEGTDWQAAMFRKAPVMSHQLSVSGGSEKNKYFFSVGYFDQEGVIVGSNFNRYSVRLNLDSEVNKWLQIGNSFGTSITDNLVGLTDQTGGIIHIAAKQTPDIPVYNFDGSYAGASGEGIIGRVNPIAKALDEEHMLKRFSLDGNFWLNITLFKGLSFRSEFGGNINNSMAHNFSPTYKYGDLVNETNKVSKQSNNGYFWQFHNYLTYQKLLWTKHSLTIMLGQEASEWAYNYLSGSRTGLPVNDIPEIGLGDPETSENGGGKGSGALSSYFGRLNYNLMEKYYITFTYRADGSSNFGPENRWAFFPSVSAAWRLSKEPFMESMIEYINDMKLQISWGKTGNQNIGGYAYGVALTPMPTNLGNGFRIANHANPSVQWEASEQTNFGLDLSALNYRITLAVDYYYKISEQMLLQLPLPAYMGTRGNDAVKMNPPWGNFGKIANQGIEIALTTQNFTGQFKWETGLSFTHNKNKLIDLGIENAFLDGYAQWFDLVSRSENGRPLYDFYGYKVDRVFRDKQDILNSPVQYTSDATGNPYFNRGTTVWPGDLKFIDVDGNDTIDINDRTYLGSPIPKFVLGFNNDFRYKGFDLNIFIFASYGNKVFNYLGRSLDNMRSAYENQLKHVVDRAKLEPIDPNKEYAENEYWWDDIDNVKVMNPETNLPRSYWSDPNVNDRMSDRYVEDGSYIRIKNISLGYTLPSELSEKAKIVNIRIFFNLQNLYTFTRYTGYDPEIGQDTMDKFVYGLDNGRYPSPRSYVLGLKITL